MRQTLRTVSFLHWPVAPAAVAHLFPVGCEPDVLGGHTYLGLVGLRVTAAGLRRGGRMVGFGQVNVRLYSRDGQGRQGVVFLSLDVDRPDVALAGRLSTGLPFRWSRVDVADGGLAVRCRRRWPALGTVTRWLLEVGAPVLDPSPSDIFLTARWGLHAARLGSTWWLPISHEPWRLYRAEPRVWHDELAAAAGVPVPVGTPPSALWSPVTHARLGRPVRL
ncbi:MAG TPA: DUF2071 domain-containing protein [Mycobacteriales bacterium]